MDTTAAHLTVTVFGLEQRVPVETLLSAATTAALVSTLPDLGEQDADALCAAYRIILRVAESL